MKPKNTLSTCQDQQQLPQTLLVHVQDVVIIHSTLFLSGHKKWATQCCISGQRDRAVTQHQFSHEMLVVHRLF